ncbi:MAG: DUF6644 family protein [Polyangiaceae bacterium]
MNLDAWLTRLQDTDWATAIRESGSLFPWVESVHVLALTLVVGSISVVDLRLLGWASRERPVRRVLGDVLPCTWIAFAIATVSGGLLFSSNALTYAHNPFFRVKIVALLALGVNAAVFGQLTSRGIDGWDVAPRPPLRVRASGAFSLVLWIGVVLCGRWIGFTRLSGP